MKRSRLFKSMLVLMAVLVVALYTPVVYADEEEPMFNWFTIKENKSAAIPSEGKVSDFGVEVNDSAIGLEFTVAAFSSAVYPPDENMIVFSESIQIVTKIMGGNIIIPENTTGSRRSLTFRVKFENGSWLVFEQTFVQRANPDYLVKVESGTVWYAGLNRGSEDYCPENEEVAIRANTAPAGQEFDKWISNNDDVVFADETSPNTTFTMPAENVTVTATYKVAYEFGTLVDLATGVSVSGWFSFEAALQVEERFLHDENTCDACDKIRSKQANGEFFDPYHISLPEGDSHRGDVQVEIMIGAQYAGKTATIYHCDEGTLEAVDVIVDQGGWVRGTFSSLSLFAVGIEPEQAITITGLPECYTMCMGGQVSWTPDPAEGSWEYDSKYLSMKKDGDKYTFKAIKNGKTKVTYTINGESHTVDITINKSMLPQIGDCFNVFDKGFAPIPSSLLKPAKVIGTVSNIIQKHVEDNHSVSTIMKPLEFLWSVGGSILGWLW